MAKVHLNRGPLQIRNSAQVLPGVYRSEAPTMAQILASLRKGQIDRVISLNIEMGIPYQFDDSPSPPMTRDRSERIKEAMKKNFSESPRHLIRLEQFLKAYLRDYEYSLSASSKNSSWHELIGLGGPERFMAGYFEVLKKIQLYRQNNLSVLFHCAVGKHRTGLIAMLIKALDTPPKDNLSMEDLYLEFIHFNWFETPISKAHYMLTLPLILRSSPFKGLQSTWISSTKN
ncbi:tyrosine-protein phosphatase [bacterium]|nr:tyrosine-protein phosphatase [bacterium]